MIPRFFPFRDNARGFAFQVFFIYIRAANSMGPEHERGNPVAYAGLGDEGARPRAGEIVTDAAM